MICELLSQSKKLNKWRQEWGGGFQIRVQGEEEGGKLFKNNKHNGTLIRDPILLQ